MTQKEFKELGKYLETKNAAEEAQKLYIAVKDGGRTPESLTDREVALYTSLSQGGSFLILFMIGTAEEKKKGIKLMRKAIKEGKRFFVGRDEAEGVFESQEEMEEYMSHLEFHMDII